MQPHAELHTSGTACFAALQIPAVLSGRLERRYKRFLADVTELGVGGNSSSSSAGRQPGVDAADGIATTTVHCPNTGSMKGLLDWPRAEVLCSTAAQPKPGAAPRKYPHTLEAIRAAPGGAWVSRADVCANVGHADLISLHLVSLHFYLVGTCRSCRSCC
jgi:hypothetical protein